MKNNIRIIIVEDHPEFRETIEFVLGKEEGLELVNQYGNAELALRSLQNSNTENGVDIILLDLNLPGISGLEAIRWFKDYAPLAKILVLSQSDREADVIRAVRLGASGYLLKSSTMTQIIEGIRIVNDGGASLDSHLAKFILKALIAALPNDEQKIGLSPRELEVLNLIARGQSQKQVAVTLNISTYTVTDHLKHIYQKMDVKNAPEAIDKAHRRGIFQPSKLW
jgi:two-component system nitrate/nitrite response regulator NarL